MIRVGASIKDILCYKEGVGMMGYGLHTHIVKGQKTPLRVRTIFIRDDKNNTQLVWVVPEILSGSIAIKRGVLEQLKTNNPEIDISDSELMISATHTHSGPGGYFDYAIYNMSISGFEPYIYSSIVKAIVESIVSAYSRLKHSRGFFACSSFEPEINVAFNRSVKAINKNPETLNKYNNESRHMAVDREMKLLSFVDDKGRPFASINWFGVHTTSVGNDLMNICWDNKGYAAELFEQWKASNEQSVDYVASFAQEACGDVSPNHVWDIKRNRMRGADEDDYLNAKNNGSYQYEKAKEILLSINDNNELSDTLDSALMYVDLTKVNIDPEFSRGLESCRTGPAAMGLAFFGGATDGMGISNALKSIVSVAISLAKLRERALSLFDRKTKHRVNLKYKAHGKKEIFMETSEGRILGGDTVKHGLALALDEITNNMKRQHKSGGLNELPWTPDILPIQINIIGELAILAIPGEITTIAAKRLKQSTLKILEKRGVKNIVVSCYSNAYAGYITTYEEYQTQCYEGGHTLFGEWTLAAYQTKFKELALEMLKSKSQREYDKKTKPHTFKDLTIKARTYGNF